jgi:hypothetical protein
MKQCATNSPIAATRKTWMNPENVFPVVTPMIQMKAKMALKLSSMA